MTILLNVALALAVLFIAFAVWVRIAPTDPAIWHVNPAEASRPTSPNWAEADRVIPVPLETVAARIAERARAEGARLIAGDESYGTWEARTRLMRYPDYVSIRLTAEAEGTRVQAFSRSRFGYGDGGVNRARLRRWVPEG